LAGVGTGRLEDEPIRALPRVSEQSLTTDVTQYKVISEAEFFSDRV